MSPRAGRASEVERECALWPAAQAARWRAACAGAEPASWRPATRRSRAYVWSLYLAHCRAAGLSPSLTAEGVTGFAKVCAGRGVSGRTFATYGGALAAVAQVVEPGNPVIVALERRNRQAVPLARRAPKRKHATLLRAGSADALVAAACRELDALWPELAAVPAARLTALLPERPRLRAALVRCRGALTVALLLACPDRRSACSQLTLASLGPGLATIVYPGETTKPERDNRQPIPAELRPHLTRWLELREAVATGHDRLWVSFTRARVGAPAAPDTLYRDVGAATKRLLGVRLWPHLLRDLAATFAREAVPERPALASAMLDHQSEDTTRIYTALATDTAAIRQGQEAIAAAVAGAGRKARASARGPSRAALAPAYRKRRQRTMP
jgi:integrase